MKDPFRKPNNMFAEKMKKMLSKLPESRLASNSQVRMIHGPSIYGVYDGPLCQLKTSNLNVKSSKSMARTKATKAKFNHKRHSVGEN